MDTFNGIIVLISFLAGTYVIASFIKATLISISTEQEMKDKADQKKHQPVYKQRISYEAYKEYLDTPKWRELRLKRLAIDEYTCQYCGSNLSLDFNNNPKHISHIHHLHYRNLGNEDVYDDLVSLCKLCHTSLHMEYSLSDMEFHINMQRMKRQN